MPPFRGAKKLAKMKLLSAVSDINDLIRLPRFDAVLQCRKVGRGVIISPIAFSNQERIGLPCPVALHEEGIFPGRRRSIREDCNRAFAFACDALLKELRHYGFEG